MQEPDPATLRAAASGDHAAFADLVRLYQPQVWRFLQRFLGDRQLAEDVAQEAFIRVYRSLDSFRYQSKFSTWVFQIARNAAVDAIRKQQRSLRLIDRSRQLLRDQPASPELGVEIDAALAELSTDHREAFLMVELLGFTYRDAAAVLSVPEGTVKSRVFHARKALVAWMHQGEAADEG